jgi:hypothetical protein
MWPYGVASMGQLIQGPALGQHEPMAVHQDCWLCQSHLQHTRGCGGQRTEQCVTTEPLAKVGSGCFGVVKAQPRHAEGNLCRHTSDTTRE